MVSLILGALGIVLLRVADVSIGTLRIGMLVRGRRGLAGALSFVESLVWLLAAAQVLTNLDSPVQFVAYAGGYAIGTMVGVSIERWLAIGDAMMRIVAPTGSPHAAEALRRAGFVVTELNAQGRDGEVRVSFSVMPRKRVNEALRIVQKTNPAAFVSFESTTPVRAARHLHPFPAARMRK